MAARGGVDSFDRALFAQARGASGLTQADVAARLLAATNPTSPAVTGAVTETDMRKATRDLENVRLQVNDYENGSFVPRPHMLLALANALDVDAFELLRPDTVVTLALVRVRRGLLQSDLAPHLSCSREQLSRIERGLAPISDADKTELAARLDISETELAEAMSESQTVADVLSRATATHG